MPFRCQALECDYNYDSEIKRRENQAPEDRRAIFEYPKLGINAEQRKILLRTIPRDWRPKDDQRVRLCESHFRPEDIITHSKDSNNRRKREEKKLKRRRLKDDAVPCIWSGAPSYLTHVTASRPTSFACSEVREANFQRHQEEIEMQNVENDRVKSEPVE